MWFLFSSLLFLTCYLRYPPPLSLLGLGTLVCFSMRFFLVPFHDVRSLEIYTAICSGEMLDIGHRNLIIIIISQDRRRHKQRKICIGLEEVCEMGRSKVPTLFEW